jgi:hypothetical protein
MEAGYTANKQSEAVAGRSVGGYTMSKQSEAVAGRNVGGYTVSKQSQVGADEEGEDVAGMQGLQPEGPGHISRVVVRAGAQRSVTPRLPNHNP